MIKDTLQRTGLPCVYGYSKKKISSRYYLAYLGSGQNQFIADNRRYSFTPTYQVEYYFEKKNEELEETIEEIFSNDGFFFDKSEDIYLDDEDIFMLYYYLT